MEAVNAGDLRSIVLSIDGALESSHMGHPDFRGPKGIFMSLTSDECAVVFRLPPSLAESVMSRHEHSELVSRFGGAIWIRFKLSAISEELAGELAEAAWHYRNPPAR